MTYTAADFEKARFAEHQGGAVASRFNGRQSMIWTAADMRELSDDEMVEEGWVPVREANGRRDRNTYVDHIAEQDRIIRVRNATIAELEEALADAQAPLSLDSLAAAYEAAEVPTKDTPIRAGDVVIYRTGPNGRDTMRGFTGFVVESADSILSGQTHGVERVLTRAPQREPWQDLADVLADMGHTSPTGHARDLYERGVRVTGGDDE